MGALISCRGILKSWFVSTLNQTTVEAKAATAKQLLLSLRRIDNNIIIIIIIQEMFVNGILDEALFARLRSPNHLLVT